MKKILVPVDFSTASRTASEYAAALAVAFGAEVFLLHTFMEPVTAAEAPDAWMMAGTALQEHFDAIVQKELNFLKEKYAVTINGRARLGFKGETIKAVAAETGADLIVMGMKGKAKSKFVGSTTLAAIRKSERPVLVVPENVVFKPIKFVVLATDFNELTHSSCFDLFFEIVEKFDAAVNVMHVQKKGAEMASSEIPGKLQLGRVLSRVDNWYEQIEDNDVEHGILKFVQNHPADLLVMVAHEHNIFESLFATIHTRVISQEVQLPLLVLEDKR